MTRSLHFGFLAIGLVLNPPQASAQPLCKPLVVVKETKFSVIRDWKRIWIAAVSADTSQCAAASGRFRLGVDRVQDEISIVFGYDEAPVAYWVADVEPCACRN
jgi:hypothetical protein